MMNKELVIETRMVPRLWNGGTLFSHYEFEYRIRKDQLGWFKRTFCNRWKTVDSFNGVNIVPLRLAGEYNYLERKRCFKTLGDIIKFENEAYEQFLSDRDRREEELNRQNRIIY